MTVVQSTLSTRANYYVRRSDAISADDAAGAIEEHRSHAESDDAMVIYRSRLGVVTSTSNGLCVKEWYGRGWYDALRTMLYGSKARAAWRAANALVARKVNTPEPLAMAEEKTVGGSCFLITRFNRNAQPLSRVARDLSAAPDSAADEAALARAVAEEVGKLHAAGVYHGDLSAKNFLVERQRGGWTVSITDLDNIRLWRRLTRRRRLKSLSQLNDLPAGLSLRARIAFVRKYNSYRTCCIDRRAMEKIDRLTRKREAARNFRPSG